MVASSKNKTINFTTHKVTGSIDDSFVGIKVKNGRIDFYYPESYELTNMDNNIKAFRKELLSILNTIAIAKTLSPDKAKIDSTISNEGSFVIHSYLWLIRDYLLNGFYINREKAFKNNQKGRVNWKRTLQKQPIISSGNIIYTDVVVEVPNDSDNLIAEVHRYCVKKSIEYIGWLFGLSPKAIRVKPFNQNLKKLYVSVLQKELNNTFDDVKKTRFLHMLKVLRGVDGEDNADEFVYGVDNYYYIFERMIDSIFGSVGDLSKFNPKANWFLKKNNYAKMPSSELRPDTILIDNDSQIAYIIDSKYYRFGTTGEVHDLPTSTSIQKQITYGEFMAQKFGVQSIKGIRNAFIMPYNKNSNKFNATETLEYIGYANSEWKDNDEEYHNIYAFLIDLKHVISTWNVQNTHVEDTEKLIVSIETEIEKTKNK